MARRVLDARGRVRLVEFEPAEFAQLTGASEQDLAAWAELVPTTDGVYRFTSAAELTLARQRVAVLRTRMSIAAVRSVEAEGRLAAYAALAADCPPGITAHVYRSFLVLVLVQQKTGLMLDAAGLAVRAGLLEPDPQTGEPVPSAALAGKHLRLLQAVGLLRNGGERWEFSRIPACARG